MNAFRRFFLTLLLTLCAGLSVAAADFDGYLLEVDFPPRLLAADADAAFPDLQPVYAPAGLYRTDDPSTADALRERGAAVRVEPNYIVTLDDGFLYADENASLLDAEDDDPEAQWFTAGLDIPWARDAGLTGQGVRVGVVDSGLFAAHYEFQGVKILDGANYCVSESDPKRSDVSDAVGHGTFVSGLIAAARNGVGLAGLAPDVELVPLKCFDSKNGSVANITAAIYDAVDTWNCQVLNLSLGIEKESAALKRAIQYADEHGVLMVAAVGNLTSGSHNASGDPLNYPAAYEQVIGVGAVGSNWNVASFSYRNESVEVCAPGQNLRGPSTAGENSYVNGYGTSYAAPMVTAAAAVALSAHPGLSLDGLRVFLRHTVRDAGPEGYDTSYGYGILQLGHLAAVAAGNLSHQIDLVRERVADVAPTPSMLLAAYDAQGRFLSMWDASPPVALDREPDTTPILAAPDALAEDDLHPGGAASWKLFTFDRFSLAPVLNAVELYGDTT